MIKHIVFFRVAAQAEGKGKSDLIRELRDRLEALPGKIPQISSLETGENFLDAAAAYDVALVTTFRDRGDLAIYQAHPDHVAVKEFIGKVTTDRAVVDYVV